MDWLHCNKCGLIKDSSDKVEFYCGLCSHVLCNKCHSVELCPVDNRPFKAVKVNKSMPEKIRVYFEDPNNLQKIWQKCIRFQFEQRTRWEERMYTKSVNQIRQFKEEIKVLVKAKDAIQQKRDNEMKRIKKMQVYINNYIRKQPKVNRMLSRSGSTSTPMTSFDASSAHGESGVDLQFDDHNISNSL